MLPYIYVVDFSDVFCHCCSYPLINNFVLSTMINGWVAGSREVGWGRGLIVLLLSVCMSWKYCLLF